MDNNKEKDLSISEINNYSFLIKLKNFFVNLFSNTKSLTASSNQTDTITSSFEETYGDTPIEKIQLLYESGKIKENELPDYKLEELKELYVNQILQLDEDSIRFNNSL